MRVEHAVYLLVKSADLEPEEITRLVGAIPDDAKAKHSRLVAGTETPRANLWRLESGLGVEESLEDHIEALVLKVGPLADRIGGIVGDRTRCYLTIVRRYYPSHTPPSLGFAIDGSTVKLLARMRAEVDIDEYDYTDGSDGA